MKIFVISGKAKSGKSTFAELLKSGLIKKGYKPCIIRITNTLYSYAINYFGWDGSEETKPRKLLQEVGIELIREKMNKRDFLLKRLFEDIDILKNFFDVFIIPDARLIDEFENIKRKYDDVVLIKVERDKYDNKLSYEEANHITEKEMDLYDEYDYIVKNEDCSSLRKKASEIVSKIGGIYE